MVPAVSVPNRVPFEEKNGHAAKRMVFLFYALEAHGHINPLLSIADVLKERGHRTVFLCSTNIGPIKHELVCLKDYIHRLGPQRSNGLAEAKVTTKENRNQEEGEENKDKMEEPKEDELSEADKDMVKSLESLDMGMEPEEAITGIFTNIGTTIIKTFTDPQFVPLVQLVLHDIRPDVITVDHGFTVPFIMSPENKYKWVRMFSPNPLSLYGMTAPDRFPAPNLGASVKGASQEAIRTSWDKYFQALRPLAHMVNQLPDMDPWPNRIIHESPYLNFYIYPSALDYDQELGYAPKKWVRLQSMVRRRRSPKGEQQQQDCGAPTRPLLGGGPLLEFVMGIRREGHKLVFVSMGTLASMDTKLMKRLVACLAQSPHRFVVSTGARQGELQLAPNMWGDRYLPQKELLGMVDAAVIHGGNNSFTECLQIGVPGLVLCPMFADQFDNAQRLVEKQLGVAVYFSKPEPERKLLEAISTVLTNDTMRQNIDKISREMREAEYDGPEVAANHLERLAAEQAA